MVKEIALINIKGTSVDNIGQITVIEEKTDVIATVSSITQSEFMSAGQIGLKPDLRFEIWAFEYAGETFLEMDGVRYSIYRTYARPDGRTELYTERRVGNE